MPQGGGQSDWQRRQAEQRRETARREREQAKLAKEHYLASQQQTADDKTADLDRQIRVLDELLRDSLSRPPLTFQQLRVSPRMLSFEPGPLGTSTPEPKWAKYAPSEPRGLGRLLGGSARYEREMTAAQEQFKDATRRHRQAEKQRLQALASARAEHERRVARERAKAEAQNADIEARQTAFTSGDPEAVEWFVGHVLDGSRYPKRFPRQYQVAYRPENRDLVVEFELPPQEVIPKERGYRYVKSRDAIDPIPRPKDEIKQYYAQLIACVALRTLNEIFCATPADVVTAITFNGRVSTIDRTTGKPDRPHLLSVSAERSKFVDLVLAEVEPVACVKRSDRLSALVSNNPFDMEAIEPFIAFDLRRFRFTDDLDVVAGLDSRPNLLKLSPTEFEHLVRQLFVAMGAEAWTTIPSKDGGVDAVATSNNLFFGGICLIQAKRWTGLVGLESVHALTGVMADHNATTGVLVTTSWFGRASEQFAQRNRITLINGAELKDLIKKKLGIDVIPGTNPPRRLNASDNTQTGRPAP
jgi:restriction system protein